jgi:hypothetical protein
MTGASSLLRRLVVAELRSYRILPMWLLRRRDIPVGAVGFGYVGVVLPVLWAFIVVSAIELVVVHVVLPWPAVRVVADVLGVWGLLWMIGLLAGLSVRPHLLDTSGLRVRNGVTTDLVVPWDAVSTVSFRMRSREKSRAVQLDRDGPGTVLNVVVGSQTNVDVALRHPVVVSLPSGDEVVTAVRLYADEPRVLVAAARARLDQGDGATRSPG